MGRAPCCDKTKVKRGPWSPDEDNILKNYIHEYGTGGNWILLPQKAGLKRCGKSCRLRWLNYLRPNIKHGGFTEEEDNVILTLYHNIGSRWSIIASHLPERTDNDVKNYWNTKLKKKQFSTNTNNLNFAPTNNMLPNFPIKSDDEILGAQIPFPNLIEIPKNEDNIGYNFGIFSSQDVVTSSSSSSFFVDDNASTSWSIDTFLSAFEFQEKFSDEMNNSDYTY